MEPREQALAALMEAVDDYGLECADQQNLLYKYGDIENRQDSDEWAAVRKAARALVVAELRALLEHEDWQEGLCCAFHYRIAELEAGDTVAP